jgi:GNAT superfamily N-acetyltransferase
MSIEIDVLNGNTSWPVAEPLFKIVWAPEIVAKQPWRHIKWAHADLRVLVDTPADGLACHVGIYFRDVTWNGRKFHIGGIGGVATHPGHRRHGYASVALNAAIQTMRTTKRSNSPCCSASRIILHFINRVAGIPLRGKSTQSSRRVVSASRPCHPSYFT